MVIIFLFNQQFGVIWIIKTKISIVFFNIHFHFGT